MQTTKQTDQPLPTAFKRECGCIWLNNALKLYGCEGDYGLGDYGLWLYPLANDASPGEKTEKLSPEEQQELVKQLNKLINEGFRFRTVKALLS
jgi:hypothetical protein